MIFARNTIDRSYVIEAFDHGVALPFVRSVDHVWQPKAVAIEALEEFYVDCRDEVDECRRMIDEARWVSEVILRTIGLEAAEARHLTVRQIRESLKAIVGSEEVTVEMLRSNASARSPEMVVHVDAHHMH